jgi:hypothetical protein
MTNDIENVVEEKAQLVEWAEPPTPVRYKRSNVDWASIADALRANPGEWAVVARNVNPSSVTHMRQGRLKAFEPAGSFEASGQGRNENGQTAEVYARFVGVPGVKSRSTVDAQWSPSEPETKIVMLETAEETADLSL